MRLLSVVQRYGHEVPGGAETFCREFATRLAARGHEVEVLTSCAVSYVDWANHYEPGSAEVDGVVVHRLPVVEPRADRLFGPLNARTSTASAPLPLHLHRAWMRMQGPAVRGLVPWLEQRSASFDVASFFTYLYNTTFEGLPVASALTRTVLHPTAHDEPYIYRPIFDVLFRAPHAFGFLTMEEAELVRRRFGVRRPSVTTGIGVDLGVTGDAGRFRAKIGIGDEPYLVYVGRLDPGKGSDELGDFFLAYKRRNPGPLKLVVVGDPVKPMPDDPDLIMTGFVDEQTKHDAIAGALALVHPSYFESFSIVLIEAWAHGIPALVQGRCDVLAGQSRRSGAGVPYRGFAEFEAAVDLVVGDADLRRRLGAAGRTYVEATYEWDVVLDRYESLLRRTRRTTRARSAAP